MERDTKVPMTVVCLHEKSLGKRPEKSPGKRPEKSHGKRPEKSPRKRSEKEVSLCIQKYP